MKIVTKLMIVLLTMTWGLKSKAEVTIIQLSDKESDSFWFAEVDQSAAEGEPKTTAFMTVDWDKKKGKFFGELNPGKDKTGFASYTAVNEWDLSSSSLIKFKATGNNRKYVILLKDEAAVNSNIEYSYQAPFLASETLTTHVLPVKDFMPVFKDQENPEVPGIDLSKIRQIGIKISVEEKGPYDLEFGEISGE